MRVKASTERRALERRPLKGVCTKGVRSKVCTQQNGHLKQRSLKKRALKRACAQKVIRSILGLKLKIFKHCGSYSLFLWADKILLSNTINFAPINNQKDILIKMKSQHWLLLYYMLVHTQYKILLEIQTNRRSWEWRWLRSGPKIRNPLWTPRVVFPKL